MTNSIDEAVALVQRSFAEEGSSDIGPIPESSLRAALEEAPLDDRNEIAYPEMRARWKDGVFEVRSRRMRNIILNWPSFIEHLCSEAAKTAGRPNAFDMQHPWALGVQQAIRALQWLIGARDIPLGEGGARLVRELWIERKERKTVSRTELVSVFASEYSPADVDSILESLQALGIVSVAGDDIEKCERLLLLAG